MKQHPEESCYQYTVATAPQSRLLLKGINRLQNKNKLKVLIESDFQYTLVNFIWYVGPT